MVGLFFLVRLGFFKYEVVVLKVIVVSRSFVRWVWFIWNFIFRVRVVGVKGVIVWFVWFY